MFNIISNLFNPKIVKPPKDKTYKFMNVMFNIVLIGKLKSDKEKIFKNLVNEEYKTNFTFMKFGFMGKNDKIGVVLLDDLTGIFEEDKCYVNRRLAFLVHYTYAPIIIMPCFTLNNIYDDSKLYKYLNENYDNIYFYHIIIGNKEEMSQNLCDNFIVNKQEIIDDIFNLLKQNI